MELVTIKELSLFLKAKESTIYSWVHNRTVPYYKVNGLLRFDMDEIRAWMRESRPNKPRKAPNVTRARPVDIDRIIDRTIENVTGKGYNPSKRETRPNQGLRKEV